MVPKCKNVKDLQVLNSVENLVTKAIALVDASSRYPADITKFSVDTSTIKEPSNKNGVKQDNLYSTEKKRKQTDEVAGSKKPSTKIRRDC